MAEERNRSDDTIELTLNVKHTESILHWRTMKPSQTSSVGRKRTFTKMTLTSTYQPTISTIVQMNICLSKLKQQIQRFAFSSLMALYEANTGRLKKPNSATGQIWKRRQIHQRFDYESLQFLLSRIRISNNQVRDHKRNIISEFAI